MTVTIARARREDAFACAALRLQMDLEAGESNHGGFLTEYADYFLAHFEQIPTWIATSDDGTALGMVQTSIVCCPPSLARSGHSALHVSATFVTPAARNDGLTERLLRTVDSWADAKGFARLVPNSAAV